ncbi:MAG: hypothetical protein AAGK01_03510 [Pseudomonadota bacterium]
MRGVFQIGLVASAMLLNACGESGTYYEQSPVEVAKGIRLAQHPTGGKIKGSRVTSSTKEQVKVILTDDRGVGKVFITANISPDGTGSRVVTEVSASDDFKGFDPVNTKKFAEAAFTRSITGKTPKGVYGAGLRAAEMDAKMSGKRRRSEDDITDDWGS